MKPNERILTSYQQDREDGAAEQLSRLNVDGGEVDFRLVAGGRLRLHGAGLVVPN